MSQSNQPIPLSKRAALTIIGSLTIVTAALLFAIVPPLLFEGTETPSSTATAPPTATPAASTGTATVPTAACDLKCLRKRYGDQASIWQINSEDNFGCKTRETYVSIAKAWYPQYADLPGVIVLDNVAEGRNRSPTQ